MREARLRPEFAQLYPGLTPGRWEPASRIAEAVLANVLLYEMGEAPMSERLLGEAHFEFRGGAEDRRPSKDQRARLMTHAAVVAMDDLRYPIGAFAYDGAMTDARRAECVVRIAAAPSALRAAVAGLSEAQLDTPYRPEGWTVRQLVHHLPDSHINAYTRIRLALTEDTPTIKPYQEARWAELPDARSLPVAISLALLEALHARWVPLLQRLGAAEGARQFRHPEHGRLMTIDELIALYAWHGEHHTAHVTRLRQRMGWR